MGKWVTVNPIRISSIQISTQQPGKEEDTHANYDPTKPWAKRDSASKIYCNTLTILDGRPTLEKP